MAQQLNLCDPRLLPRRPAWSSRHAAQALVLGLGLGLLATQGLRLLAARDEAMAQALTLGTAPLREQLGQLGSPLGHTPQELSRLKAVHEAQQRVLQALSAGVAGNREGHADYLLALARQAPGTVWITRFAVSEDGQSLELDGRMTDAAQLAAYLRRLNAEPRFRGRPFAQLQMRSLGSSAATASAELGATAEAEPQAAPITEFTLRSLPAGTPPGSTLAAAPGLVPGLPQSLPYGAEPRPQPEATPSPAAPALPSATGGSLAAAPDSARTPLLAANAHTSGVRP